jgi:hypothetical protein
MDLDSLTQKSHTLIVIDEDQVVSCDEVVEKEVPVGRSVFVFLRSFVGIANDEIYPFKKIRGWIRLRLFYPVSFRMYPDIPPALLGYYYKRVTFYKRVMP